MSIDAAIEVLEDTDPEIAAGRIFGVELPKGEAAEMPRQAVVVSPAGGPEDVAFQQITTDRLDFLCFGETVTDAYQLSESVHRRLKFFEGRATSLVGGCIASLDQAVAVFSETPIRTGQCSLRRG